MIWLGVLQILLYVLILLAVDQTAGGVYGARLRR